jgi:hypothetical protein
MGNVDDERKFLFRVRLLVGVAVVADLLLLNLVHTLHLIHSTGLLNTSSREVLALSAKAA